MNGKNIIICILDETSKTPIAATKSNEWKTYVEDIEVSSPTQGDWVDRIAGRKDWSVTTSYLVTAVSDVKKCLNVGAKYRICFCENTAGFPVILQGQAMLKECNGIATLANLLQGSFQFVGCGMLFVPVTAIELTPTSFSVDVGDTQQITPTVTPSDAAIQQLQWESSDTSIATVDNTGLVTGVSQGSVTITCRATDDSGISAICSCEVHDVPVSEIVLGSSMSILINTAISNQDVPVSVLPENATNKHLLWTSSDPTNMPITQSGDNFVLIAHATGTYRLTATATDGSGISSSMYVFVE